MNFNIGQEIRTQLGLGQPGGLRAHLIRGTAGTVVLTVILNILALVTSVVMARMMGAEEFGIYAYTMAVVNMLFVLSTLGFPQVLIRDVSAYRANGDWGLMRGLIKRACQTTFLASVGIGLGAAVFAYVMIDRFGAHAFLTFLIGLILLPLLVLTQMRATTIRGLGYIFLSQVPMTLIRPCLFLILLGIAYQFMDSGSSATSAMTMQVVATVIPFIIILVMLWKVLPVKAKNTSPVFHTRIWIQSAWPLLFVSGMQIVSQETDILMLGALKNAEEVGLYRVAQRGAGLVSFGLIAVNLAIGPTVSTLYTRGEMQRLQRIVTRSVRAIVVLSIPLVFGLVIFGYRLVPFVYGAQFAPAATPLAILCMAYLVTASLGSVSLLLNMCGYERDTAKGFAIAAVLNILLNALLIPSLGVKGAAIATSISIISWSILLAALVYRRIGINATIFSNWR